ncbi:hypothetical protein [Caballeronia grimmiae]
MSVISYAFALCIPHEAFDAQGRMKDSNATRLVSGVGEALHRIASRLA